VKDSRSLLRLISGVVVLAGGTAAAQTQTDGPPRAAAAREADLQEVIVTGYRRSLEESTQAKRDAIGFIDQINAEDIGKFPDSNIAESFNRVPGITIVRDITGEGTNITIRGLGTNFTKILLNGAPVAIASSGPTDAQNSNREVDLDLFPTELFSQLTVKKTSSPEMVEGGAAGTVDMRSARPFDNPGAHLTFTTSGQKNQHAPQWGERGALIASDTWDNGFGALVGVAAVGNRINVKGFETIGWTNANLSAAQCGAGNTCNGTGGGNWTIPGTVPAGAGNGLVPGTTINNAFLLAHNPGLTTQQIDNALIPRLGRPSDEFGSRDRENAVVSLEYRPNDALHFYVDSMWGHKKNNEQRIDMDWVGRNGAAIPLNMTVDRPDCSNGCVATGGTFANSQFFLEYRPYLETTNFYGINPGFNWEISDSFKMDLQANKTQSTFHREVPSVLVATPLGTGLTTTYSGSSNIPIIQSSVDLDNPANFGWNAGTRVNIQDEKRDTVTKGVRVNFTWGKGGDVNLRFGGAYDDILRKIRAYDNSQAWQNAVCGDNPNIFVMTPNGEPACQGLNTPTPGSWPNYPAYPGLVSAGLPRVVYQGSLIPQGAVPSYLARGPAGFVTVNWPLFAGASNYSSFHNNEPATTAANTTANAGLVEEKAAGFYVELTGDTQVPGGNRLRYTGGVRYVHTSQTVGGYVSVPYGGNIPNVPAAESPQDGVLVPNVLNFVYTHNTYHNLLPAVELAYNLTDNAIVRLAGSRTLTRPDPNAMLPGLNFSQPSADVGTVGNPALKPYLSDNFDLGLEYYTGREGVVGATFFRKRLTGFTANGNTTVPFSALAPYGITYSTLTPTQQQAINTRGGPDVATVVLQEQVNASGALTINGFEFTWVQPLDFLLDRWNLDGFGFSANYTLVDQFGSGAAPAVALGIPPHTYNVTFYYEHGPWMARISTVYNKGYQNSTPNQNGITNAAIFADDYRQWDFSSIVDLSKLFNWSYQMQLTADATNLFGAKLRQYFQFRDATFTEYDPGRTITLGVRAKF
jgi:TonB-dependent receptor